ncbi:hypothetical protein COCSUDRAFT_38937 [Coccomyxa subellipsoidea C-169]|uniref:Uncharacterized protein n=1 Tax=Coccomyxa subellipsoidea (strain C-169) TaxID=574566 RepID=I0Z984_COCSC|nr:hypothetical protein COCSUDRAFT_38937 [Coccomyxa subellipsoidea C-169]EIE27203.1 hypothetical protein COCSUDRAFT_38937 [Coccomyxa subellipsoidea C-169]|eukprot:XP_005651747.1 hypothetical protein COCSUDRAFT_38937 [Coccomyxa subellipsoidea C-169]
MHGLGGMLQTLGSRAEDVAAVHTMAIIEEQAPGADAPSYTVFDFLPADAMALRTTATLMAGGSVKGILRERQLRRLPRRRCSLIGEATVPEAMQMARCFNEIWPCELKLLVNDCHSHTAALVHHLTGQTITIEKILPLQRYPLWM